MSTESSKGLKRHLQIVMFLLKGTYVSSKDIQDELARQGTEVELRTIQRDLLLLEKVFPVECRRDSSPHGWRWKRVQGSPVTGLNMSQALTLLLVEEQLHSVMSPSLLAELQPLFVKARLVTGCGDPELTTLVKGAVGGALVGKIMPVIGGFLGKYARNATRNDAIKAVEQVLAEEGMFEEFRSLKLWSLTESSWGG